MDETVRARMSETYFQGGVSMQQLVELGSERPEIEAFLAFSAKYEGAPFRALHSFGGIEFCFDYGSYFEEIGVSGQSLAKCMDADTGAIRSTCRKILEAFEEARARTKSGETHLVGRGLAVNPTAAKAFILAVLDAKERYGNDEVIPELYFLLSLILFPGRPDANAARASDLPPGSSLAVM